MTDRFVVLGVAGARSAWFAAVGQWSHAGSIPVDFVKCVSSEQARIRLRSGRMHSAALLDGMLPTVDRDLFAAARAAGTAVVVVDTDDRVPHWLALGADATLGTKFGPDQLVDVLRAHAAMVAAVNIDAARRGATIAPRSTPTSETVVFCGAGGTGSSTLAMAFAQQWVGPAVLADLCLDAEQGVLHDAGDVGPGVQELVDMCRTSMPDEEQVRAHTYSVTERGYALLLGLRRAAAWPMLRPRAVAVAIEVLQRTFGTVVFDCDAEFEGQADGGSLDVEERNVLARSAAARADIVFAVGAPGVKGVYSLARVVNDLCAAGVAPSRIAPVFNRTTRGPNARARLVAALAALVPEPTRNQLASAVFVLDRGREVERALHDRTRLPATIGDPLVGAYLGLRATFSAEHRRVETPRRLKPGELHVWPEEVGAS